MLTENARQNLTHELGELMSELSEKCFYARWLVGTENILPEICNLVIKSQESERWGQFEVTVEEAKKLCKIANRLGHWVNFNMSLAKNAPLFVPYDPFIHPDDLTKDRDDSILRFELNSLNQEIYNYFKKHPDSLYSISPRQFEELIAGILVDMGCEIQLTPQTRDGGRDILASFPSPVGRLLTIVECKRYRPERKIGIDIVDRLLQN